MAKEKEKKKKGKAGKTVAGAGILAIIAALLGFGSFGFGMGGGTGTGTGTETGKGQNQDYLMQDNQKPTVVPPATVTPAQEQEEAPVVQLTEVMVTVKKDKTLYNGAEYTAQSLADFLEKEYAEKKESILIKITLEEAVYDTVEALKVTLEDKGITYEIAE